MIIDFYKGNGGGGGGGVTPAQVRTIVNAELDKYTDKIENGDPVVGMAAQLQSIDGFESNGVFTKRTSGGDASLTSGEAKLLSVYAETTYKAEPQLVSATATTQSGPRLSVTYNGDLETLYTQLEGGFSTDEITFTYDYVSDEFTTELADMGSVINDFTINGTPLDGESFTFKITELEGPTFTASTTYDLATRSISASVDAEEFEDNTYVSPTTAYTYTYTNGSWGDKPASVTFTGSPIEGDQITVNITPHDYGTIVSALPTKFKATSMNCFDKDMEHSGDTYNVTNMVPNLTDGYVIYSNASGITSATVNGNPVTVQDNTFAVIYPTSFSDVLAITTSNPESICVHPRWSGTKDEVYGEYWTSEVAIPQVDNFYSIGNVHNEIDMVNGQYIERVSAYTATEEAINALIADSGKTYGVDYIFDDSIIVETLDSAVTSNVTVTGYTYQVDDFGTEEFDGYASADLEYKTNLVDKLRVDVLTRNNIVRLTQAEYDALDVKDANTQYIITDATAVDMDSYKDIIDCTENGFPTEGEEGKVYKYEGNLYEWTNETGSWGKWIKTMSNANKEYYNLCYDYLPASLDGQMLCSIDPYGGRAYLFFDLQNNQIKDYNSNDPTTGTLMHTITKNGPEVGIQRNTLYYLSIKWVDNYIYFFSNYAGSSPICVFNGQSDLCSTTLTGWHYQRIGGQDCVHNTHVKPRYGIPFWNEEGAITDIYYNGGYDCGIWLNQDNTYGIYRTVQWFGSGQINFFAPTNGGTAGQILRAGGSNTAPTWVNLASMMGGLTIWCGTEDQYEAIATKDSNTLYIIREE